jgi:hypothetical protein
LQPVDLELVAVQADPLGHQLVGSSYTITEQYKAVSIEWTESTWLVVAKV